MKFKLWDLVNECWYDRGDIFLNEDGQLFEIEELGSYERYMNKENVTARYELLRYTGLKDKNGKEIYEGDIVRKRSYFQGSYLDFYKRIVYHEDGFRLEDTDKFGGKSLLASHLDIIEVIGNIYENGELLSIENN